MRFESTLILAATLLGGLAACDGGSDESAPPPGPALLASGDGDGAHAFGLVETGTSSPVLTWTITNTGESASGTAAVSRTGAQAADFAYTTTCSGALAPLASCTVSVTFTPGVGGARSASFSVSATPGGAVSLDVSGAGGVRLDVTPAGAGTGTVTSSPAGIDCGADCSEVFEAGTSVTLSARTANGAGSFFQGWGGACGGSFRDCAVSLPASATVEARFSPMTHNVVFVTSATYPANAGGAAAYDDACNAAATAAGLNDGPGSAYVAWVSDSSSTPVSRLGTARGWMLLDGRPFTDTLTGLTTSHVVWNPVTVDETGLRAVGGDVLTGTLPDGTANTALTCADWTSATGSIHVGERGAGPRRWTDRGTSGCAGSFRLYCFMKTRTAGLSVPPAVPGKRMWVTRSSASSTGGISAMDALCTAEKPAGVAAAQAFVATSTRSAASLLSPSSDCVTVDGQLIASGADLQANVLPLLTGPWQRHDGSFTNTLSGTDLVTTGAAAVNVAGTLASTCTDWTSTSGTHARGIVTALDSRWFLLNDTYSCAAAPPILCIEQ